MSLVYLIISRVSYVTMVFIFFLQQILRSMPSICTANYHGNRQMTLLVYTLDNFLIKQRLGTKEQQNVLKFVMETSRVRS
jgi:hypothetical protein